MIYLLDANVLIALLTMEHPHKLRAEAWFEAIDRFAVCPITQGALVRILVRYGKATPVVMETLRSLAARPGYEFWADSLPYEDADLRAVIGHRQVTDAYLVALAGAHEGGRLATLDEGLATTHPSRAVLIPA